MKALNTSYASVELQPQLLKIVWKGKVQTLQFKLVLDLVTRLVEKHSLELVVEDQSNLVVHDVKGTNVWLSKYYIPFISPRIKNYYLIENPGIHSVLADTTKLRVNIVKSFESLEV